MNEKIKQLADEAGFMDSWFSESGDDCERELKKFAELIARDICKIVKGQKLVEPLGGYQDWENGYNASVTHAVEQIKRQYQKAQEK